MSGGGRRVISSRIVTSSNRRLALIIRLLGYNWGSNKDDLGNFQLIKVYDFI